MKKDIYLFGHHLRSFSNVVTLASEGIVFVSATCQLAVSGTIGDDDAFTFPNQSNIENTFFVYGKSFGNKTIN